VIGASLHEHDIYKLVYYAAFVIIFQIGWASVQISHLSLIPDLTDDESEVAGLNGYR
jgi:Na+/melibiose symporter-like transporter